MAKIVIDARNSGTSTGRYVDKLLEHMHKLKPEFEIIVLTKAHRIEFMKKIAPNFKVIESDFKEFTFAEQLGFNKQLKGLAADLVHFAMPHQPVLYRGKKVTTFHDLTTTRFRNPLSNRLVFFFKQAVYKRVLKRVAKKSLMVICISNFMKNDVAQYCKIPKKKIAVTYLAADRIKEKARPIGPLVNQRFIMYVGRPLPHKNLRRLMEAYSIYRNLHKEIRLVLVGKQDKLYESHVRWAHKEHVEGLVFTGWADDSKLRWLYEHTAAYIFPSLSEGFGLPGLEAMVHGAPVVSSDATSLPEIYGDAAEYFDPNNITDMLEAIKHVLDEPKRAQQLRHLGSRQAAKYSWQKTAQQTLEVYRQALKN